MLDNHRDRTIETRCPVHGEETAQVTRLIDVSGGAHLIQPVHFEFALKWLRESTARTVLRTAAGDIVNEGSTHNDFYGFLTSMTSQIKDAPGFAASYGLDKIPHDGAGLEVGVLLTVTDRPVFDSPREPAFTKFRAYEPIEGSWGWFRRDDALTAAWLAAKPFSEERMSIRFDYIRERHILRDHTVWSSRRTGDPAAQETALKSAMEPALEGLGQADREAAERVLAKLYLDMAARSAMGG
jgi:hypothetical protein